MSLLQAELQLIENRLNLAGYETEVVEGVIYVLDPAYSSTPDSQELKHSHSNRRKIPSIIEAWSFIEERL